MKKVFAAVAEALRGLRDGGTRSAAAAVEREERPRRRRERGTAGVRRNPRRRQRRDLPPPEADPDNMRYRFGFLIHSPDASVNAATIETWRTERVGGYVVRLHPETGFLGLGAAVIGRVAGRGGVAIDGILNALLTAAPDRFAALLGDLVGRFAVIVVRPDGARVFNDAFGSRTLFYSPRAPGVIASHSALLAEAVGASPSAAVRGFMQTRPFKGLKVKYLPGDLTLFEEIYGLSPNNFYLMTGGTERYWPIAPRVEHDREHFFSLLDQSIADLARLSADRPLILGITGGADSRVICAGLVRHGKSFEGVTWVRAGGGYLPEDERPAVDQTAAMLGLRHHYMDVDGPVLRSGAMSSVNSGYLRGQSALVSGMASIASPDGVFVRGYGGEIIRGFYNIQRDPMKAASPDEFGRMYQKRNLNRDPFVLRTFEAYWERANWDNVQRAGYDVNDIFYWEHRMGMWGAMMLNMMDSGVESWVGLNSRPLYEAAFGLDPKARLTKAIFAEGIARLHYPLTAITIFDRRGNLPSVAGEPRGAAHLTPPV